MVQPPVTHKTYGRRVLDHASPKKQDPKINPTMKFCETENSSLSAVVPLLGILENSGSSEVFAS
jgi:hypothetical protein